MDPKVLRQHARDCTRLAEECPDGFFKEALRELAAEFASAADPLETSFRNKSHNPQLDDRVKRPTEVDARENSARWRKLAG